MARVGLGLRISGGDDEAQTVGRVNGDMRTRSLARVVLLSFVLAGFGVGAFAQGTGDYEDLVSLFHEFRAFGEPEVIDGLPDYSNVAMAKQARELKGYQARLAAIDPRGWPVPDQIDYHLVRAEMNGLEFRHRVLKPWVLDPGFYNDRMPRVGRGADLPIAGDELAEFRARLASVERFLEQARRNLSDLSRVAADLGTVAVLSLGDTRASFESLAARAADAQPELTPDVEAAMAAIDGYVEWIETNKPKMTARAGVGKENYNWLLKNVYLFPYTWDDVRTIVELEDNRVIAFGRLEENRNQNTPRLTPVASQEEYRESIREAVGHIMNFLREGEVFSLDLIKVSDEYFHSRWEQKGYFLDQPWPEKHDYFFNFSHREAVMENTHELVGHHFDQLRAKVAERPIRRGRRPYNIGTARGEGFAFALEELLMHAGYLDGRSPRGREIAYEQAAFRTVRALSDIYMHNQEWTYDEAYAFCVANAPHGELLDGSHHLWFELDTTLRGVGHHMLMVVGKVQFMKLFRDRAQQLGDEFVLRDFMDEFLSSASIPMSLIRWEMTGYTDEIETLWPYGDE